MHAKPFVHKVVVLSATKDTGPRRAGGAPSLKGVIPPEEEEEEEEMWVTSLIRGSYVK